MVLVILFLIVFTITIIYFIVVYDGLSKSKKTNRFKYKITTKYYNRNIQRMVNSAVKDTTGTIGESVVTNILLSLGESHGGYSVSDVLLRNGSRSSQIDNVFVTNKAVYVIEMKNYSGWIYGSEYIDYWTQTFVHYKSKKTGKTVTKKKFYNPIKQNKTHISALRGVVKIPNGLPVINIVVFGHKATLKSIKNNPGSYVTKLHTLRQLIIGLESKSNICIDDFTLRAVVNDISRFAKYTEKDLADHTARIYEKYKKN